MKGIATINFKGGVGKTTITWLLAKYVAERLEKKVLVIDTDAQMSLTLAVQLQEDGRFYNEFNDWYETQHKTKQKTILNALEAYESLKGGHFDFPINTNFIYEMSSNLHFIPSDVDLYWLELDVFDREKTKFFIQALMGKIEHSKYNYDYIFFDCPPNFTALSYSVLSCSSLLLIPVNPDVFASRGVDLLLDGLHLRIEPWPSPKIGVFMNKAKMYSDSLTKETQLYLNETKRVCEKKSRKGIHAVMLDSYIPERVDIKRAIPKKTFPDEYETYFSKLWNDIERIIDIIGNKQIVSPNPLLGGGGVGKTLFPIMSNIKIC